MDLPTTYSPFGRAYCDEAPADELHVGTLDAAAGDPPFVAVVIAAFDETGKHTGGGAICLVPAKARAMAAALLNAADALDGTTPLVFMPKCAQHEAKEPRVR